MELLIGPIRSQDLGRYADLEHVWAVGVAIAVRKDIHGHWFHIQRDSVGRGVAGIVTLSSGVVLRVSHWYFTGFDAVASRVSDEGHLVSYLRAQLVLCWDKG